MDNRPHTRCDSHLYPGSPPCSFRDSGVARHHGLLKLLAAVAAVYGLAVLVLYASQHHLIYYPNTPGRQLSATPAQIGLRYEDVRLTSEDGVRLHGWWVPGRGPATVLFLHGNAGNVSHRLDSIRLFHDLGLSVFILDYRGYGSSEGRPTEAGTYLDAAAAWRYLTASRGIPAKRIAILGRSLGAAVAAWLARLHTPGALVVESAFTSVPDLAQEVYPWVPARRLSRYRYSTREYVAAASCPVLVVHGRGDRTVPFHHGEAVYRAATGARAFLALEGSHNMAHAQESARYANGLAAFLAAHGLLNSTAL